MDDDRLLDDPFDDDSEWQAETPQDPYEDGAQGAIDVSSLLREIGIDRYDDIVVNFDDIDVSELRGQRFDSIEEAIIYLYDIGILSFSEIVEFDDDTFGYVVTYGQTE